MHGPPRSSTDERIRRDLAPSGVGVDLPTLFEKHKWEDGERLKVTLGDWEPVRPDAKGKTFEITFHCIMPNNIANTRQDAYVIHGTGDDEEYGKDVQMAFHDYLIEKVERAQAT